MPLVDGLIVAALFAHPGIAFHPLRTLDQMWWWLYDVATCCMQYRTLTSWMHRAPRAQHRSPIVLSVHVGAIGVVVIFDYLARITVRFAIDLPDSDL